MLKRLVIASICLLPLSAAAQVSSHAGQEDWAIKALSPQEVDDLLSGRGMGVAKVAELNGFPGPAHALDLAADLGLGPDQVAVLRQSKQGMTAAAVALGREVVETERALDRLFAEGRIERDALDRAAAAIGGLQARLRVVHLTAHVETRAALTDAQVRRYQELRGYRAPRDGGAVGSHHDNAVGPDSDRVAR